MSLVSTIRERCRVCYTCVRECPAKAIRIAGGQAEVIDARCIGCGNCVRVCSQGAKRVLDSVDDVRALLAGPAPVAACVAPAFPAEFTDVDARSLAGMVRALGFASVHEVAFGADLVAARYRELLDEDPGRRWIATTCPAVTSYVERFHPGLVSHLAPVVSPMIATARALRKLHGDDLRVVFIGPCLAKKEEAVADQVVGEIDGVLTFAELRRMLAEAGITAASVEPGEFDAPRAGAGALFPISRGMLAAAGIDDDLVEGRVIAAGGHGEFQEVIREFDSADLEVQLLEVLCCTGCVMGPGMTTQAPAWSRRQRISHHVQQALGRQDAQESAARDRAAVAGLDLSRGYAADDQRLVAPSAQEMREILVRMGKRQPGDELNCGACGYPTCREHALAIHEGLAENEMCLPYTIEELRHAVDELAVSHVQLASAQEALVHSEKLASMGQLAAGIAHEVNNPLGVVLMYSHMLLEETAGDSPLRPELATIVEQTDRAKRIVAGLLNFARQNKVVHAVVDAREVVARALRAVTIPPGVEVAVEHEGSPEAELDAEQILQVLVNLLANAVAAMPEGGRLLARTEGDGGEVRFIVTDTGTGIAPENRSRIFTPFFTTKKAGQGTGLGLAVSYGIVKMHRGDIHVVSNADPVAGPTGTAFTVALPARRPANGERTT
ncbi:MAG: 4Fe-4S dicluster domain-containing protein [bacterium]|nr:4Fe-4S dicluster domain-containing protein [bacterium]